MLVLGLSGGGILSFSSAFAKVDNDDEPWLSPNSVNVRANPPGRTGFVNHAHPANESKSIPDGRAEFMDADRTSLIGEDDGFEGNLGLEDVLGSTVFAVLDRVELTFVSSGTFETSQTGASSFIGDPGGTDSSGIGSSGTGSVATSGILDIEASGSCGAEADTISALESFESAAFRIVLR
jgi:hypothetical protein